MTADFGPQSAERKSQPHGSTSHLYKIAQLLNKPIEYFYGEDFGDRETQDMLAVMRKQPKGTRSEVMEVTNLLMQMQSFEGEFRNYP